MRIISVINLKGFTFHSGSSQTCRYWYLLQDHLYLHSTLVLLKPFSLFTSAHAILYLHSTLVLLKPTQNHSFLYPIFIYIPLWFFSNFTYEYRYNFLFSIYIPLWFFSNACYLVFSIVNFANLHSTLVLLKHMGVMCINGVKMYLHSTLVLLKLM